MTDNTPTEEVPVAAAAPAAPVEEEKKEIEESKEETKEESKEVTEIAPDANLSEIFVNLDEGVPSDVITSLCMEC